MPVLDVDPDIARARTPPGELYGGAHFHELLRERVLRRGWHAVVGAATQPGSVAPFTLLEGCLDEPLIFTCDETGGTHCLSNVCTHRGSVIVSEPCRARGLRCPYHGRRFALDGRFTSMPRFEGAQDFPGTEDDLPRVAHGRFGPLAFVSLDPAFPLCELLQPLEERSAALPLSRAGSEPASVLHYEFDASWVLYCDNYLEGFHIPFVHPGLAKSVDLSGYETLLTPYGTLQIAAAKDGEHAFELPAGHADHGRRVAGYYFFLYPTTMLNFYPWGLSLNLVQPLGPARTRVVFATWVWDASRRDSGAGADLHAVELEDEAVVTAVQRGVRSRLYRRGRYSPSEERGVHHFHRLLSADLG